MIEDQRIIDINNYLPLSSSDGALRLAGSAIPLAGSDLPLAGAIQIYGNDQNCAIDLDPLLKLHELDVKHNAEGIYHNKITPPVVSSIYCYLVRKRGELRHYAISKQGDTWLIRLFNPLTQQYEIA